MVRLFYPLHLFISSVTSGKKKIASLASGRTRCSGGFRCNLHNSDPDRHGTVCPDAVCHGICLLDRVWQGIFLLDARCQGIVLLDAAVSRHFPSEHSCVRAFSFWTQPCQGKWHPDDACHGTVVMLAVKAGNLAANTRVAFTNTQQVPGIVTQSSSIIYLYLMYIYRCYYHTSCFQHKHPASHPSP